MAINSSLDEKEVEKFSKFAAHWWDLDGEFKMLHQINPIRVEYIIKKIKEHFYLNDQDLASKNFRIIDIGCGGGIISSSLYRLGLTNITAIDASPQNIEAAVTYAKANKLKINYIPGEIKGLVAKKEQYDVILCLEVMEHVAQVGSFLQEMKQLLKPGGMMIISTINRTPKAYLFAILMAEYILKWITQGTHDYHKFLKPSEIQNFINNQGLEIKELKGLTFNPFNQTWKLSSDISINYFAYIV